MTVEETETTSVTEHPAYVGLKRVVDEIIAPAAVAVDASEIPAGHIEALKSIGWFGWAVPEEYGGNPVPQEVHDAGLELVFGACPSTGLILSQHGGPVQHALRVGTPELLALLPRLASGELIGAGAFGHVRSWPARRSLSAKRVEGGFVLDGTIPFISGWGLVNLAWTGAIDEESSRIVFLLVDLPDRRATSRPLQLAAIQGSRTVALDIDGLFVPQERVVLDVDVDEWKAQDGLVPPHGKPGGAVFPGALGLARAALADARRYQPEEPGLASLSAELEKAAHNAAPGVAGRTLMADLVVRATTAALIARGGSGLAVDDITQVRSRAALFLQVRGLSPRVRGAQLERLVRREAAR